jgi:hypothetical protein
MKTLFAATMFGILFPLASLAQDQSFDPVQPPMQSANPQDDVVVQPVSPDTRPDTERPVFGAMFLPAENGMKIQSVFTNGPMYQQEIFTDDLIPKLDKVAVRTQQDIFRFLMEKKPDDVVVVTRIRDGVSTELSVKLMSQARLLEVSNTTDDAQANISRQYVGQTPPIYQADVLLQVDQKLKSMQQEIESLRAELERLRKDALQRQQDATKEDEDT